jgi:DNA polymerase-1
MQKLFIIDGHSLFYRCYHAPFAELTASDGTPTKGTYLFTDILIKMLDAQKPDYLSIVFDSRNIPLYKNQIYPEYKQNREAKPPEVYAQIKQTQDICRAFGIHTTIAEGYEADDLIASITKKFAWDLEIAIVTGDKDLGALLEYSNVRLFDAHETEFINAEKFEHKKGFPPHFVESVLAFMGDSCDNIPPVGGIGLKGAIKLLSDYKNIHNLKYYAEEVEGKTGDRLRECIENGTLDRNIKLTTLDRNIKLDITLDMLKFNGLNFTGVKEIFTKLGFKKWMT